MYDLVIVGAGPAGLTAAVTAADHGLSVLVVDEQRRPGGQIFRQPPPEFQEPVRVPGAYRWGRALLRDCEQRTDISWRFSTTAYGVLRDDDDPDGLRLALYRAEGPELVRARRLLVATGAYDLPVAFPGWTLPGVLTAGGVQTLLKSQRLLAARRLVLAGSHPLLLLVADQLRAAGAEIAEVAFARGLPRPQEALAALPAVPGLRIFGPQTTQDRGGIISFDLAGVHPHDVGQVLDAGGVEVRVGHHCARPTCRRFGVAAMTRASFYLYTTETEIDALVDGLMRVRKVFG